MMKKAIKKLLAALLAVAMVCAMAVPAFAGTEGDITKWHSFSAFQIFTGDVTGNEIKDFKISNVEWGSNIADDAAAFLDQLKSADTIGPLFAYANSARDVLEVISQWHDSDANSIAFARFVCHYLYPDANAKPKPAVEGGGGSDHIHFDKAGYYLVVDTTPFNHGDFDHAYNSFLLMVTRDNWNVPITPKAEKPSVKKEVFDNFDNQDGTSIGVFGSSADHAINEKFQFKLTATLPASTDHAYDYYDTYAVCFKDTLSEGITYDGPDSVVIKSNNNTYDTTIDTLKYTINTDNLETQNYFEVNIPDVKACAKDAGFDLNDGATITFTYTAHLNEKATVNTTSGPTDNKNSVQLKYSNNPRPGDYWGTTPKSEVYVFTYQLNNTKRAETENGTPLPGAGFRLYSDADYKNEVKLYQDGEFYYPIKDATDKNKEAVEMKSAANGQFNVKGLDAGTYYLKETTTPADFTPCSVIPPVTITANHNGNHVELDSSKLSTTIINKKAGGITLPSTGGIGTTIFYVVGGGLMVAAIVLLVTKKRMENK
ncbi:isopeptide-forming domain-containing fimbrial protein [Faecalibacterium sp. HTF-76H]|uniref:Isopeptide-forming domain-containing fimbrial protein n=1 Tax=Faecalibacterium taiwanense TaxID=3030638 RepID=A0AB35XX81_9FIRM